MQGPAELAEELTGTHPDLAIARLIAEPGIVAEVAGAMVTLIRRSVGGMITLDGSDVAVPPPKPGGWTSLQTAVSRLAALVEKPQRRALVEAMLDAIMDQAVSGLGTNPITDELGTLLLSEASDLIEAAIRPGGQLGGQRLIIDLVWKQPGQIGADWLLALIDAQPIRANSIFQDMVVGKIPSWEPADWALRLDALAASPTDKAVHLLGVFGMADPPSCSAAAQVRLACAFAREGTDLLVRTVAGNLAGYRGDDPDDDLGLVAWDVPTGQRATLRWLLELMGPSGYRRTLVQAAVNAGRIAVDDAQYLASDLSRPAWADGRVPWAIAAQVLAGELALPDGRLAAGDPFEGRAEFVIEVAPGTYPVTVWLAEHPLSGRACAAAEVTLESGAIASWFRQPTRYPSSLGYITGGYASFGSPAAYEGFLLSESDQFDSLTFSPESFGGVVDSQLRGLVYFSVLHQHAECATWVGVGVDGKPLRIVTDLGILDHDHDAVHRPPWD